MNRIVTISFTQLDAPGGVPKFNRDLHAAFQDRDCIHFCWFDFPWYIEMEHLPEWEKARTLNHYLLSSGKLKMTDVVVADGFWADGLQAIPLAISHSHGIWSHLTKDDVDAGKQPENPWHHAAQVTFRERWIELQKKITTVSEFIAEQMRLQWGFKVDRVINNGVDTKLFTPAELFPRDKLMIIHGINDPGNMNKGWDHIAELQLRSETDPELRCDLLSLDQAAVKFGLSKPQALAQADLVVHPSGYEGNSMFVAEALACGVPVVGYDVGFLGWHLMKNTQFPGVVMDRKFRSPAYTVQSVKGILAEYANGYKETLSNTARCAALNWLSAEKFAEGWRSFVREIEDDT
jgi:glycosyltransferase involved in cell wall biosynthesis